MPLIEAGDKRKKYVLSKNNINSCIEVSLSKKLILIICTPNWFWMLGILSSPGEPLRTKCYSH